VVVPTARILRDIWVGRCLRPAPRPGRRSDQTCEGPGSKLEPGPSAMTHPLEVGRSHAVRKISALGRSALFLTGDERLELGAALVVGTLHGWGLHQVGRRGDEGAADAAVLGDLGRADAVDDDAG
jgi:hypothetical protein